MKVISLVYPFTALYIGKELGMTLAFYGRHVVKKDIKTITAYDIPDIHGNGKSLDNPRYDSNISLIFRMMTYNYRAILV